MSAILPSIGARVWHPEMGPGVVRAVIPLQASIRVLFDRGDHELQTPAVNVRVGPAPKAEMRRILTAIVGGSA